MQVRCNVIACCLRRTLFSATPFLTHPGAVLREFESRCFPFRGQGLAANSRSTYTAGQRHSLGNLNRHWLQSSLTVLPSKCLSRNSYYSFHGCQALYLLLQSVFISRRFGPCIFIWVSLILHRMLNNINNSI